MKNKLLQFKRNTVDQIGIQTKAVIGLIIIIFVVMTIGYDGFASSYNIRAMISNYVPEGIIALGMTIVIISGGIDLSVAGVMPFSAIIFCLLLKVGLHFSIAMLIVLIIAASIGTLNNFFRDLLDVHPFIITLAVQLTLKGFNLVVTKGASISGLPDNFKEFTKIKLLGLKLPLVMLIVLSAIWLILLMKNRFFRQAYLIGGNPKSAELSGINTKKIMYFIYIQSAVLSAVAGIAAVLNYQSANYSYGNNLETRVITAVVVGGISMTKGGVGKISGAVIGLIFTALVFNAFLLSGINTYYQDVITGSFLIAAVLIGGRIDNRKKEKNINKRRKKDEEEH